MRLTITLFLLSFLSQLNAQTTVTLKPGAALGKDAEVASFAPAQNRGTLQSINLITWTRRSATSVKRAYVEFDLSSIPSNAIVQTAKLKLNYDPITYESFSNHSGITEFEIRRVTTSWLENTLSWNSQPSVSNLNKVDVPAHTSGTQNYSIEVGNLVNDMLQNGNHGFQLRMKDENNPYRGLLFASSDHPTAALHPELQITYVIGNRTSVFAGKDAMVYSNNPNGNYGDREYLVAYALNLGGMRQKRIYAEFDLSSIPANAKLDSAFLNLFFEANPNEGFPTHTGPTDLEINRVDASWLDSTISWSNQPTVDTSLTVDVPPHNSPTQDYRIKVTSLVANMRQYGNNGFRIKMKNEQSGFQGVMFASAENTDSNLHPYLDVYWSLSTGLDETLAADNTFEIFPNPSEGIINLSLKDLSKVEQVQIYDSRGKLMRSFNLPRSNSLDLSEMANGLYFMSVQFESGQIASKKFILN